MSITTLIEDVLAFRNERDWAQFHTPRHLSAALAVEAAELQELLLWKSDDEVQDLIQSSAGHEDLSDEVADVLIYALLLCDAANIDLDLPRFGGQVSSLLLCSNSLAAGVKSFRCAYGAGEWRAAVPLAVFDPPGVDSPEEGGTWG